MKFKNGYKKALTFSFDDGVVDDIRLIELFKKYGIKATFNLNSASLSDSHGWTFNGEKYVTYVNYTEHPDLYDGFEVASHTYRHPFLEKCNDNTVYNEIRIDCKLLEFLYGCEIKGMALPFGTYNERTVEIIEDCGMKYCRTVKSTNNFEMPDGVMLHPTCHFLAPNRKELAEEFINAEYNDAKMFYIWGHSYELVTEEQWQEFEEFCAFIANKADIWYCTNIEAVEGLED